MVTRRTMLSAAAAGATLGAVASASAAAAMYPDDVPAPVRLPTPVAPAADRSRIPRTIAAHRSVSGGRLRVARTDFRLSHLGVAFEGGTAQVRTRTESGWGAWTTVSGCGGAPDGRGGAAARGSALLVAAGVDGYDIVASGAATVVELNTVDGPAGATAAGVQLAMPLPGGGTCPVPYLSRAAWGADESLRFKNGAVYWPETYYPIQTVTVHHTAGTNDDPDPAATVRGIYYDQTIRRDWGDIGYHLLIDEAGRVYEGRVSGADGWPVFGAGPGADGRPLMSVGGHVQYFNAGNIGVCLMGNFHDRLPTPAALTSLARVLVSFAGLGRLDPLGSTKYLDPVSKYTDTVQNICGHRDWAPTAATECPGDAYHPQLPALRSYVAGLMAVRGPGSPQVDPTPQRERTSDTSPVPPGDGR